MHRLLRRVALQRRCLARNRGQWLSGSFEKCEKLHCRMISLGTSNYYYLPGSHRHGALGLQNRPSCLAMPPRLVHSLARCAGRVSIILPCSALSHPVPSCVCYLSCVLHALSRVLSASKLQFPCLVNHLKTVWGLCWLSLLPLSWQSSTSEGASEMVPLGLVGRLIDANAGVQK